MGFACLRVGDSTAVARLQADCSVANPLSIIWLIKIKR